jgi:hypothetical protein
MVYLFPTECKAIDNPVEINVKLGESSNNHLVEKGR